MKVEIKELLEAGAHFGHQTRRWNPKMRGFIYTQRDGVHIIDLAQTCELAEKAAKFIADTVALGNSVLFVGTKKQARDVVESEAKRCGQFFVSRRWLGGMLTNFKTIKASIDRLNALIQRKEKGELDKLTKKEALGIEREIEKLEASLGGIKEMKRLPGAVFIIDPSHEEIAKKEASRLGLPIVAVLDTNCNPDGIDYPIPANDDAIRSIRYLTALMAEACLLGRQRFEIAARAKADQKGDEQAQRIKGSGVREQTVGGKGRAYSSQKAKEIAAEAAAAGDVEAFSKAKAVSDEGVE